MSETIHASNSLSCTDLRVSVATTTGTPASSGPRSSRFVGPSIPSVGAERGGFGFGLPEVIPRWGASSMRRTTLTSVTAFSGICDGSRISSQFAHRKSVGETG